MTTSSTSVSAGGTPVGGTETAVLVGAKETLVSSKTTTLTRPTTRVTAPIRATSSRPLVIAMIVALLSIPALAVLQGEPHPRAIVPAPFNGGLGYDQPMDQLPQSSSYYLTWSAPTGPTTR